MPNQYNPEPRSNRYKVPNKCDLANAVMCIKQKKMSYREAAKVYGIHHSVIYRHVKNPHMKKQGGQTSLTKQEEDLIIAGILLCSEWGYPFDKFDVRLLVKGYLDRRGKKINKFKNGNMPGRDRVNSFLKRIKDILAVRMCQNIKRSRAGISRITISEYFDKLAISLDGVPPSNILNYDETNLTDDPGRKKIITKRGTKYPERIMNHSKTSNSIMFAGSADGTLLPPYTVYKAKTISNSWRMNGPKGSRYASSKSGWFDSYVFDDWIRSIAIPYLRKLPGRKILIGDNLSSHISTDAIKLCQEYNISFVFLPANSTHLTQPLDVAFFRPLKCHWRKILETWKKGEGRDECSVPEDRFPRLLNILMKTINEKFSDNLKAGFEKCGIYPLNRDKVLDMLPSEDNYENTTEDVNSSIRDFLKTMRSSETKVIRQKRKKLNILPGQSVEATNDSDENNDDSNSESLTMDQSDEPNDKVNDVTLAVVSDTDEDDNDSECSLNYQQLVKHNKQFDHVFPINGPNEIKKDDWLPIFFQWL